MNSFVPIYVDRKPLTEPPATLAHNWFGAPARFTCHFFFEYCDEALSFHFHAQKQPDCDPYAQGTFVEGLWERDVAEFFVKGEGSDYQEFNLSPNGAWWSAHFRDYRDRLTVLKCPSATTTSESGADFWKASLTVKAEDIVPARGLLVPQWRLNVSAILDPREPEFLCHGHRCGGEPDFHLAENFLPVEVRRLPSDNALRVDLSPGTDLL